MVSRSPPKPLDEQVGDFPLEKPIGLIDSFPEFRIEDICKNDGPMAKNLADFIGLYALGRSAVYWAFQGMGLAEMTPAWFPSFHCGVEVEAAANAGFDVRFYRVREDLQVDQDDLEKKLRSRPGPVLVIHYFGFPQPEIHRVAELCRAMGVALVEDCTHALFSRAGSVPLGDFGPIAVFSLAKTLGLCCGGALKVDISKFRSWVGREFTAPAKTRPAPEVYRILVKDGVRRLVGPSTTDLYRRIRYGAGSKNNGQPSIAANQEDIVYELQRPDYRTGLAWPSRQVIKKAFPSQISERRTENYSRLAGHLADVPGMRPVFSRLPEGTCPLVLPIWVEDRDELENQLQKLGVHCYVFGLWRYPLLSVDAYPEARRARRHILGLPVHQYLSRNHMDILAKEVSRLLRAQSLVAPSRPAPA